MGRIMEKIEEFGIGKGFFPDSERLSEEQRLKIRNQEMMNAARAGIIYTPEYMDKDTGALPQELENRGNKWGYVAKKAAQEARTTAYDEALTKRLS